VKILAVDTALGVCSAAVLEQERVLAHAHVPMVRGHAEALAPMVEAVMREANLSFAALERLAVTTGPGTFTGQRVGIAFMRGLRVALKIPLIGVTTLDAMCAAALAASEADWAFAGADAKRGEIYCAALSRDGLTMQEACLLAEQDAFELVSRLGADAGAPALAGTAAPAIAQAMGARGLACVLTDIAQPDAVFVARLALQRPIPASTPLPLYLRAPDAKLSSPKGKAMP
jgi:tRNA threonylcarbamoyl adenosine modification protein YeaZ